MTPILPNPILTSILHYLPPQEVGKCRRVCHLWRDVIDSNLGERITQERARVLKRASVTRLTHEYISLFQESGSDAFPPNPEDVREYWEGIRSASLEDLEAQEKLLGQRVEIGRRQAAINCKFRVLAFFILSCIIGASGYIYFRNLPS